ncbi:MAG: Hsp33 family molecular chaperone HslO [Lachnospiraceae bacterium]|nr:Hsp33 family molecular chaperone HslO [Candidatus Merdinaster equi]
MNDYIVRATAAGAQIRAFAATTQNMVELSRKCHETSPVITAALGRLLTGAAMMGSMMKGEGDVLTIQVKGTGPVGGLTVTANSKAQVKGYAVQPQVILPASAAGKLDVGGAVGNGILRVVKDMGLKEPFASQVEIQTGEIAEDLTYYFAVSEQVPSSVGLGVLMNPNNTVRQAGGFIVQLMPFADESTISKLEENIKKLKPVTTMLDEGNTPEQMLEIVLEGLDVQITDTLPTSYECDCSKERFGRGIISIGRKDIVEMINDGKPVEVCCQFCEKKYIFSIEEMKELLKSAK